MSHVEDPTTSSSTQPQLEGLVDLLELPHDALDTDDENIDPFFFDMDESGWHTHEVEFL